MFPVNQNKARVVETTAYEKAQNGETAVVLRRIPVKLPSLQQLPEVFATSDLLTEEERRACNKAAD
jgi:hypothetical protein